MRVLAHIDPVVLEKALLDRIDEAHTEEGIGRTLVVVPTLRLADHVQRRLASRRPVWLGVEVLHFRALAYRILDHAGQPVPELLTDRLREAALEAELRDHPRNSWSAFAARRPGARRALLRTLTDLREADLAPRLLKPEEERETSPPRLDALAALYRGYLRRLEAAARRGHVDETRLLRDAARHAPAFARSYDALFLHGAYDLIGIQLDLLRSLNRGRTVSVLLDAAPGSRVSRYAERFVEEQGLPGDGGIEPLAADIEGRSDLAALYDEKSRPAPAPAGRFVLRHAQGAAAEVRVAIRRALQAVADGCPPHEIAIVARGLGPYAAALEEGFYSEGIPWTSSLETPLRRQPLVHDFLKTLTVVDRDFPRGATAELLASPRLSWSRLPGCQEAPTGDRADRWSREAGLIGGLDEWTDGLATWASIPRVAAGAAEEDRAAAEAAAQRRRGEAQRIGGALRALESAVEARRERRWGGHARRLERLLGTLFAEDISFDAEGFEALRRSLGEMSRLEAVLDDRRTVSFSEMRLWLEETLDRARLRPRLGDDGGIRVLDATQLRGMTFRHVLVLGMHAGQFPAKHPEDPILPDGVRARLRRVSKRPLDVRSRRNDEERLLLAMMLGAGRERVEVSWQRADENGKARTPSLALREVARLATGHPEVERLAPVHLPSHPQHALETLAEHAGLLSPDDALLLGALRGRGLDNAEALIAEDAALAPGVRMLRATESFSVRDGAYDARIGTRPEIAGVAMSVSAFENLGDCPLQFFFRRVLRVRELEAEAELLTPSSRELGLQIHDFLEGLYHTLHDEGALAGGEADVDAALERARELARVESARILADLEPRLSRRLPVLWRQIKEQWDTTVLSFVDHDLRWMLAEGWQPSGFEVIHGGDLDLGDGVTVALHGRFDRVLEKEGRLRVGDYKTGNIERRVDPKNMLKGQTLQVPLYRMLSGGAAVELLGVGPRHDPAQADYRHLFDGFAKPDQESGFLETLRTLESLRQRGSFPYFKDGHCRWCAYAQACRRSHPPTEERAGQFTADRDFAATRRKSTRTPLLEAARDKPS